MHLPWGQIQWNNICGLFGNDEFNIRVWGSFIVSVLVYWGVGGLFTFVDITGKPEFMKKYKIQEDVKSYPISRAQFFDLLKVVGINQLLVVPLSIAAFYLNKLRGFENAEELPDLVTCIYHSVVFLISVEIGFYYTHRLMHHPFLYKRIHKKHHTWISPVAISATYCRPIEHIVCNLTPVVMGPILLNSHAILLWIWITLATISTLVVHSGYHLPFLPSPEFHDFHHLKFNYNYGVLGVLDYLHGTDVLFRQSKQFSRHKPIWTITPVKQLIP